AGGFPVLSLKSNFFFRFSSRLGKSPKHKPMRKKILSFVFLLVSTASIHAQLSGLHYLPLSKQGVNNAAVQQQAIYRSTPESTTFTVNAYRGVNNYTSPRNPNVSGYRKHWPVHQS
ncbi:MAG: hypothetical protein QM485_06535, partial [Flavobacteriaceae bacterium]